MADWQTRAYVVACATCNKERVVSRVQYWRLKKGLRNGCRSCAETGNKKSAGFTPQAKVAQRVAILGNKFAVDTQYTKAERKRRAEVMRGNKYAHGIRGEAHHSWRGGKGTERHTAMGRSEYKVWRDLVFLKDNYTCQICEQYSGYLHADHIVKWADNVQLRYDVNNGRTLCRACHYYITFKRKMPLNSNWGLVNVTEKRG